MARKLPTIDRYENKHYLSWDSQVVNNLLEIVG